MEEKDNRKWEKNDGRMEFYGRKHIYCFTKNFLILITRQIERLSEYAVSVAIPVKDLTTAKKIVELIGL